MFLIRRLKNTICQSYCIPMHRIKDFIIFSKKRSALQSYANKVEIATNIHFPPTYHVYIFQILNIPASRDMSHSTRFILKSAYFTGAEILKPHGTACFYICTRIIRTAIYFKHNEVKSTNCLCYVCLKLEFYLSLF